MNLFEIIFIGLGLSMDAAAVSMTNGMVYSNMTKDKEVSMPIFFGVFQGIMPILGFYAGSLFEESRNLMPRGLECFFLWPKVLAWAVGKHQDNRRAELG